MTKGSPIRNGRVFFCLTLNIKAIKIEKSEPEVFQFRKQGLAKEQNNDFHCISEFQSYQASAC
jgi:hypothetical protein